MSRMRALLVTSVLLNVFLAGALVGGAFWIRKATPMIAAGSLRIAGSELPLAERQAFRAVVREARLARRADIAASRAARARAADLLRRPSVDQPAVLAELARARDADMVVRASVEESAVRFAGSLPARDRTRLAEAMAARTRPMPR